MKSARKIAGICVVAAVAVLLWARPWCKRAGTESGFEYVAGWLSAEVTGVAPVEEEAEAVAPDEGEAAVEEAAPAAEGEAVPEAEGEAVAAEAEGEAEEEPAEEEEEEEETFVRLEVPARLGGRTVRSVAARAFWQCTNAMAIKIPRHVSRIGPEAFAGCTYLMWAELPSHLRKLEEGLFYNCIRMTVSEIPDRVVEIGPRAYYACFALQRVAVPEGLKSVGAYAFSGCSSLEELVLPDGVTELGPYALNGCEALKSFVLPPRTEKIAEGLFSNCMGLETVEIPAGVREIGESAFSRCDGLRLETLPDGVTHIGPYAFNECLSLEEMRIPAGVGVLPKAVFEGCSGLERVELPEGLTTIGSRAFRRCMGLEEVEIPAGVTVLGTRAFEGCASLRSVRVPDGVRNLRERTFAGCGALRSVALPAGLEDIGDGVFAGCRSLERVELPEGIANIPEGAFEGCGGLREIQLPAGVTNIGARAFAGCAGLERIGLPEGVRSVGADAFAGCGALERVELPASVESVGAGAFARCGRLREIAVAGGNAGCKSVDGVLFSKDGTALLAYPAGLGGKYGIPDGVVEIGDNAFEQCGRLKSVAIPGSVEKLGARAFAGCSGLRWVELPPGLKSMGRECFRGSGLHVVAVPPGVAVLEEGVFAGCRALAEARFVPGLETICENAFGQCPRLAKVSLPVTVREVHPRAFADCKALGRVDVAEGNPAMCSRDGVLFGDGGEELVLFPCARGGAYAVPEGVKRIGASAFRGSGVGVVGVPAGVELVGESAFRDCRGLREAVFGEGVREFGDAAFMGCSALRGLVMPESVEQGGGDLFAECGALELLVVPDKLPRRSSPTHVWQVSHDCVVYLQSEWEEERLARRLGPMDDPFGGLYEGEGLETVAFEGTVLAASAIPDPDRNDYDDCLQALLVEIDSLLSDPPEGEGVGRTVLVNVPIMKGKRILYTRKFKPGSKISCRCAAYEDMPQAIQEIQLSDDIQSFEYQQYYPLEIRRIEEFREDGNKEFAKRELAILPIRSLPRDGKAAAARRARIQGEIARIEGEIAAHGGSFDAWREEYRPVAEKYARLCEEGWKGWTNGAYFAADGLETTYNTKDYIEGLLPYKKHLEENNIDLVVVRVPSKGDFAARVLASDGFRENPDWVEHYYQCLKNDIEVVDPMPEMWKGRFDFPLSYFYHVPSEHHPCEGASFAMAKAAADVLSRYPFPKAEPEIVLTNAVFETTQTRFFWPAGNEAHDPGENMSFNQVFQGGKPIGNLSSSTGSPFVFLSNSLFWYPQRILGASVPGYTAWFLQTLPDWFYQDGTANPMIRNLVSRPQLLDGRRAVVMAGAPYSWNGFPPLPKYILDHARRISLEKTLEAASDEIAVFGDGRMPHAVQEDGSVLFKAEEMDGQDGAAGEGAFGLEFGIPCVEGKNACMVRVNFAKAELCRIDLSDGPGGEAIDTCSVPGGWNQSADLFVPLRGQDIRARMLFTLRHPERGCSVENVELWYY